MSDHITLHYWGENATSPCGRYVGEVYQGVRGHGYVSNWNDVDCEKCLKEKK
jgi:hypothetical protein